MLLILIILSSVFCLTLSVFLFSPRYNTLPHSKEIGVLFTFEGIWQMLNYIISGIWPSNDIMDTVHYAFIAIMAVVILFSFITSEKSKSKAAKKSNSKK